MTAYYNEIDPYAAQWLRNLIAAGHIAPGVVDERSIIDVKPEELDGYTQCHFFAGIGIWSLSLRSAGWSDDRPVWTGSCPCQPFSAAGKGGGFDDERHLWPAFQWLIQQRRPGVVFGEQVASKDGLGWLDLVSTDLEAMGYACGAVPFPAAGVGAPHIRQRLYWVADAEDQRHERAGGARRRRDGLADGGDIGVVANDNSSGQRGESVIRLQRAHVHDADRCGEHGVALGDANNSGLAIGSLSTDEQRIVRIKGAAIGAAESVRGFWRGADWIYCRDGKFRPVEPGTFPLAHGATSRVGRLRAYGNAIVKEQAQAFIEAYLG